MRSKAFSVDFVITIFRYFKLSTQSGFSDYSCKYILLLPSNQVIISRYPSKKKNNNKWGFFFSDSFTNFAISN